VFKYKEMKEVLVKEGKETVKRRRLTYLSIDNSQEVTFTFKKCSFSFDPDAVADANEEEKVEDEFMIDQ
jgi:hypothetical protein